MLEAAGSAEDAAAVEAQLSAEAAVAKAAVAEEARDAAAEEKSSSAAKLAVERGKVERIESAVREQEAAARMKRVKKSIWHFTISLTRRALLGKAWQVLLTTS